MELVTRIANVNSPVIYVKAGRQVSGALTKTGLLYTWGRCGKHNMLGYSPSEDEMDGDEGETKTSQPIPRSVQALKQVVAFDFGIDHAAAVTKNGQLFTWGEGKFAQLGLKDLNSRTSPSLVIFSDGANIIDVGCGTRFTICVATSGKVYSWGVGTLGQLGHEEKRRQQQPKEIKRLSNITTVSCGQDHAIALDNSGAIYSWGHAEYGCLGRKPRDGNHIPGTVDIGSTATSISCGSKHNAVIVEGGIVFSWGLAGDGRLGLGKANDKPFYEIPQEVSGGIITQYGGATSVSCGHKHTACTTLNGHEILVWGCADDGRLGVVNNSSKSINAKFSCSKPTKATLAGESWSSKPHFVSVSCGNNHSLAIDADGNMYAWGSTLPQSDYGQCGHATSSSDGFSPQKKTGEEENEYHGGSDSDSSGVGIMTPRHSRRPKQLLVLQKHGGSDPHPSLHSPASRKELITASFHHDNDSDSDSSGVGELGDEHKISTMKRPTLLRVSSDGADPHPGLHTPTMRQQDNGSNFGNTNDPIVSSANESNSVAVLKKAVHALQKKLSISSLKFGLRCMVKTLNKHHTILKSNALHHWRMIHTINAISDVAVGEVSRVRDDHDRIAPLLFRNAFHTCYINLLRRGFNKLMQNWMTHNALEKTYDARRHLEEKLVQLVKDQDRAKQRLHYNREILRSRLLKTSVRYGRDKIVAVIKGRHKHSARNAFARWKLHSQAKERADSLRRGRLKLRVNMDRIEMEREKFDIAQKELARSRKMFGVFLAFHKWRQHRQRQMYAEDIKKVYEEREFLKRELSILLQHMEELKEARNATRKTTLQRGSAMLREVEDQIQQVTSASEKRKTRIEAWIRD